MVNYQPMSDSGPTDNSRLLAPAQPRDLSLPMKVVARPRPDYSRAKPKFMVCVNVRGVEAGASCGPRGGEAIREELQAALLREDLDIEVAGALCLGTCDRGPTIRLIPNNSWFYGAHVEDVPALLAHLKSALDEYAVLPDAEVRTLNLNSNEEKAQ